MPFLLQMTLTLDPYVLQLLDNIQAEYNALTEAQKALGN